MAETIWEKAYNAVFGAPAKPAAPVDSVEPVSKQEHERWDTGKESVKADARIGGKDHYVRAEVNGRNEGINQAMLGVDRDFAARNPVDNTIIATNDSIAVFHSVKTHTGPASDEKVSTKGSFDLSIDSKPIADAMRGALRRAMKDGFTLQEVKQLEGLQAAITTAATNDKAHTFSAQETTDIVNLAKNIAPEVKAGKGQGGRGGN